MIWRVRDRETFRNLAKAPRKRRSGLSLAYLPGGEGPPRVAYAVARRVGRATERNLVRRRLRHAVRSASDRFAPGAYLFGVGAGVKSLEFSRLCLAVAGLVDDASGSTTSGATRRDAAPPGRG